LIIEKNHFTTGTFFSQELRRVSSNLFSFSKKQNVALEDLGYSTQIKSNEIFYDTFYGDFMSYKVSQVPFYCSWK